MVVEYVELKYLVYIYRHYPSEKAFVETNDKVKRGDIVGVRGKPGKTHHSNVVSKVQSGKR
jgi:lysyl-tRNA synthetase class II